jgi:toxin ParE1/3/4
LKAVRLFYEEIDPAVAHKILTAIFETARRLAQFPLSGREGRVEGTRELAVPHSKFIIAYHIRDNEPIVLAVYHSSRQWPTIWLDAVVRDRLEIAQRDGRYFSHEDVERYMQARMRGENPDPPTPETPQGS